MKNYFKIIFILFFGYVLFSFNSNESNSEDYEKYNLEHLALSVEAPNHLKPYCGESFCMFRPNNDSVFESIEIRRYYLDSVALLDMTISDSSSNKQAFEIASESIKINGILELAEEKNDNLHAWAEFSAENYTYKLTYTGLRFETFKNFLESIYLDNELLKEQYKKRPSTPNFENKDRTIEISILEGDYLINRKKNRIIIKIPEDDEYNFYPSCHQCMLERLDTVTWSGKDWTIFPTTSEDSVKIELHVRLPENKDMILDEKWLKVKDK
jgi:hypothetical protein